MVWFIPCPTIKHIHSMTPPEVGHRVLKGEQQNVFLQVMAYFKKLKTGENDQPEMAQC